MERAHAAAGHAKSLEQTLESVDLLEVEVGNAPTKRGFNMMFELARHVRKVWSRNEMLSRCEPIAPVDPASDSDDEPDDGDDGAAAPGRRRRRAPRKRSTEELVVSKQLLSCTRHAGRMEDAHECLTYVLAQLLEACGVGYDGPTDAAWERSTLVHDVFECTLGQAVVCGACGFHSKAHSVELALRLNATLGLSPEELAKASAKDESPGLGGLAEKSPWKNKAATRAAQHEAQLAQLEARTWMGLREHWGSYEQQRHLAGRPA